MGTSRCIIAVVVSNRFGAVFSCRCSTSVIYFIRCGARFVVLAQPNNQRMELTGARGKRGRGASIPSGVEPARRRFVKAFSYAFCFLRHLLASSTYAKSAWFRHPRRSLPPPGNSPIMTNYNRSVQSNVAAAGQTSVNNLIPESFDARQARRGAAGFNNALQPTPDGPASSLPFMNGLGYTTLSSFEPFSVG